MKIKICKFGIEVLLPAISWGEGGFGWIKYGSNNIGQFAAWIAPDPKAEERLARELNQERK